MKKLFALILVALIGFFIFNSLYVNNDAFNKYGEVDLEERVSSKFISKSVTEENDEVVYGNSKDLESGSSNVVTSIVVNYRSFDTLGEVTVLFISALGVSLLLGGTRKKVRLKIQPSFILKYGSRLVFGIILINGIYMALHGHLTPGGGFPGGSIIAAAILLLYIADNDFRVKVKCIKITEGFAGSLYVIIGLLGIVLGGYFLYNFLPTGVVGDLLSAGIIPIVYILIGLKVGAELSGIFENFLTEEVVE